MQAKQHTQFALITATTTYISFHQSGLPIFDFPIILFSSALVGAVAPDICSTTSVAGRCFPLLSSYIYTKWGHRCWTHDILLMGILSILSVWIFPLTFGFWFGYLGHLYLDSYTKAGICWGYFINRKYFHKLYGITNVTFAHGGVHLLPKKLRFKSRSRSAIAFTFFMSFFISYGGIQLGIYLHCLQI